MEKIILSWAESHIPLLATWIIGIPAIVALVHKYSPIARKSVKIARESMDLIDTLLDALQDDKITDEEVKAIIKEVEDFKAALK